MKLVWHTLVKPLQHNSFGTKQTSIAQQFRGNVRNCCSRTMAQEPKMITLSGIKHPIPEAIHKRHVRQKSDYSSCALGPLLASGCRGGSGETTSKFYQRHFQNLPRTSPNHPQTDTKPTPNRPQIGPKPIQD